MSKAGKGNYDHLKRKQIFDFQDPGNQRDIARTSNSLQERNLSIRSQRTCRINIT